MAKNIRQIRETKKLTLDAAASVTGVSRSMLAQIEKGDANPTLSVLWKIANGYRVSFTTLIEAADEHATLIPFNMENTIVADEGRFRNYPAFIFDEQRLFETYRILIEPGGATEAEPHLTGTEEYITVFKGNIEIVVEHEVFHLKEGDSIKFKADVSHAYKNIGEEVAELSMVIYYSK